MQDLIDQISKKFTHYLNASLSEIPESEQQEIYDKLSEYLVSISSQTNEIEVLKKEFIENKFCGGYVNVLHIAAKYAELSQLQSLIEVVGKDFLNVPDNENRTPLHHSAIGGAFENGLLLINEGANLLAKSSNETRNWLPIHHAVKSGSYDMVVEMIDHGSNPNERTAFGLNCLHVACEFGFSNIVELMLKSDLDVNAKTFDSNLRMSPLHHATAKKFIDVVKLLLSWGADREIKDDNDHTCLDIAANQGFTELVEYFLTHGIVSYESAYNLAMNRGFLEIAQKIKLFIDARESLFDSKFLKGFSSLLKEAISCYGDKNFEEPKIKLENGVTINAYTILNLKKPIGFFKKTPMNLIDFARKKGLNEVEEVLTELKRSLYSSKLQKKHQSEQDSSN